MNPILNSLTTSARPFTASLLLGALLLVAPLAHAGEPCFLLKDTITDQRESHSIGTGNPKFTTVGTLNFFLADDGVHGIELWRTDGTAPGTILLRDIRPGLTDGGVDHLTRIGNTLYFTAFDSQVNAQFSSALWKSDGTHLGTTQVLTGTGFVRGMYAVGTTLYFVAGLNSNMLYKSDGTKSGTKLVKNFGTSQIVSEGGAARGGNGGRFAAANGILYFCANAVDTGFEVWRSDGTEAGTFIVKDVRPGVESSFPSEFIEAGGNVFFSANDGLNGIELWKTGGTAANTQLVKNIGFALTGSPNHTNASPFGLMNNNGTLYFFASVGRITNDIIQTDVNLYKTDGTTAGTVYVGLNAADNQNVEPIIELELEGGTTNQVCLLNNKLYYVGVTATTSTQNLYVNDGVSSERVHSDVTTPLVTSGGKIYYVDISTFELRVTDGVTSTVLTNLNLPGELISFPRNLTDFNGKMIYATNNQISGLEPWTSTGTAIGTTNLKNINSTNKAGLGIPASFTDNNGVLYYVGPSFFPDIFGTPQVGDALWKSNGTAVGTGEVDHIQVTSLFGRGNALVKFNNEIYFSGFADENVGSELYKSNGTTATLVADIEVDPQGLVPLSSVPHNFAVSNGSLFFSTSLFDIANQQITHTLRKYDGITVSALKSTGPVSFQTAVDFNSLTDLNGTLLFTHSTNGNTRQLWKSDGTVNSTMLVKDFGVNGIRPDEVFVKFNNHLYFVVNNDLWKSDGTTAGTVKIDSLFIGSVRPVVSGSFLYVRSDGLYRIDSAGVVTLVQAEANTGELVDVNGTLYYYGESVPSNPFTQTLWKSDGTAAGTVPVIILSSQTAALSNLINVGGVLHFTYGKDLTTIDGVRGFGTELWRSDGTAAGTAMVQDIRRGPDSATEVGWDAKVCGAHLFFTPYTNENGTDLWAMPISNNANPTPIMNNVLELEGRRLVSFPSFSITATNSPFKFTALNLPPGLVVDEDTGVISGTPQQDGKFFVPISAIGVGATTTGILDITILPAEPLFISGGGVTVGVNQPVDFDVMTTGLGPITVVADVLPQNIFFNGVKLSGTPTVAGIYKIVFTATNGLDSSSQEFTLTVTPPPPVITSVLSAQGTVGVFFSYTITQTGTGPFSYNTFPLPDGLSQINGVISGTPLTAGITNIEIIVFDKFNSTDSETLVLTISAGIGSPKITSALTAAGAVGSAFSYTIAATGPAPITFTAAPLPPGLTLNGAIISGSPTAVGVTNVALTAANGNAPNDAKTLVITITQATALQFSSAPSAVPNPVVVGQAVTFTALAQGSSQITYAWSFGDGTSDVGSTVNHAFSPAGSYTVTVVASAAGLTPVSATLQITVTAAMGGTPGAGSGVLTGEIDSDGDGFSDVIETKASTDPFSAKNSPNGGTAPVVIASVKPKLTINTKSRKLTFTGALPIPADYVVSGKKVLVNVGGYTQSITLSSKGTGKTVKDTAKLSVKFTKKKVLAQNAAFKLQIVSLPATIKADAPVLIVVGGIIYSR